MNVKHAHKIGEFIKLISLSLVCATVAMVLMKMIMATVLRIINLIIIIRQ